MVSIAPRVSDPGWVTDDPSWLGSAHGTDSTETVTLDASLFTAETHYPDGFIPSGTPLAKVTATGLYGPYDGAEDDGRETLVGFLIGPREVPTASAKIAAGLLVHGKVVEANLPIAVDANGKADVAARIRFI